MKVKVTYLVAKLLDSWSYYDVGHNAERGLLLTARLVLLRRYQA
jgi:hypothetical protein